MNSSPQCSGCRQGVESRRTSLRLMILGLCSSAVAASEITRSPLDDRSFLVLPAVVHDGGFASPQAVVVQDLRLRHAALTVQVARGSAHEPKDIPGLAHLAEHAFTRGSHDYPTEDALDALVGRHGGEYNAQTDAEATTFFLRLPEKALSEGMRIFVSYFRESLLQHWQKEVELIDDEFASQLSDTSRRAWDFLRFQGQGPLSRFWTGSLKTLLPQRHGLRTEDIERALRVYLEGFCSQNTRVLLFSNLPVETGSRLLEEHFAAFPVCTAHTTARVMLEEPFPSHLLGRHFAAVSPGPPELWIMFSLPSGWKQRQTQALGLARYLLEHRLEGGLFRTLTDEGRRLASSISASFDDYESAISALLYLRLSLTPLGASSLGEVLMLVDAYLRNLRSASDAEMGNIYSMFGHGRNSTFNFPTVLPSGYSLQQGTTMLDNWRMFGLGNILAAPLVHQWNLSAVQETMLHLNLSKANVLQLSRHCTGCTLEQLHYGGRYRLDASFQELLNLVTTMPVHVPRCEAQCSSSSSSVGSFQPGFAVPPTEDAEAPQLLLNTSRVEAWLDLAPGANSTFLRRLPRLSMTARLCIPGVMGDVELEAAGLVATEHLRHVIETQIIPNLDCGLCGSMLTVDFVEGCLELGADVLQSISGSLLQGVFSALKPPLVAGLKEISFDAARRKAFSRIADRSSLMPFDVALEAAREVSIQHCNPRRELILTLAPNNASFGYLQLQRFDTHIHLASLRTVFSSGGSLGLVDAAMLASELARAAGIHELNRAFDWRVPRVARFVRNITITLPNPIPGDGSSAFVHILYVSCDMPARVMQVQLLAQLLDDSFTRSTRLRQGLGYVSVVNFARLAPAVCVVKLIVQSARPGAAHEITAAMQAAMEDFTANLASAPLAPLADSLTRALAEPPQSLAESGTRVATEVWAGTHCFARRSAARAYLRHVTLADTGAEPDRKVRKDLLKLWMQLLLSPRLEISVQPFPGLSASQQLTSGITREFQQSLNRSQISVFPTPSQCASAASSSSNRSGSLNGKYLAASAVAFAAAIYWRRRWTFALGLAGSKLKV